MSQMKSIRVTCTNCFILEEAVKQINVLLAPVFFDTMILPVVNPVKVDHIEDFAEDLSVFNVIVVTNQAEENEVFEQGDIHDWRLQAYKAPLNWEQQVRGMLSRSAFKDMVTALNTPSQPKPVVQKRRRYDEDDEEYKTKRARVLFVLKKELANARIRVMRELDEQFTLTSDSGSSDDE